MKTNLIPEYVWIGMKDMYWYEECQTCFVELFGKDELRLVTRLFAATSINTSLRSNITLFRRAYYEIQNDKPVGNYLPNIVRQLEQVRAGRELTGRKINSFANAMAGDPDAVVVDIWLLRAFSMDRQYMRHTGPHANRLRSGGATDKQYEMIESWVRAEAYKRSIQPRQLSAMIWSGVRIKVNGADDTRYTKILRSLLHNLFKTI